MVLNLIGLWLNLIGLNLTIFRGTRLGPLLSSITFQARTSIIHINLKDPKPYQLHSNHLLKNGTSHMCLLLGYRCPDGSPSCALRKWPSNGVHETNA